MNLKSYTETYGIKYQTITNETSIGGNRLNRLRQGSEPTGDEIRRLILVTEGECEEFRDDVTQCYKRRQFRS